MADESQELAKLLLALKERSGRSYGALGKRLHISTSTVHRYCNGTTVPNDYAPLERLARVCGATQDELVELHRRWILADAARRRVPAAPAEAHGDLDAGGGRTGASEPQTVSAVVQGGASGAQAAPEAEAAGARGRVPGPAVGPGADRAGRHRRRRTALFVAAVAGAVTVSGAVIAAAQFAPSSGPHGRAGDAASRSDVSQPVATAPSGSAGHHSVTASDGASKGPSASASDESPDREPKHTPEASASGAVRTAASPPFHVNVLTNNWDQRCDQWFLLQSPPGRVPPPPAGQATDGWAGALGAIPAGHLRLQVTVQGTNSRPVVLHALYVHVSGARKAPVGNAYMMGGECGGDLAPASFAVDLDAQDPSAKPVPGHEGNTATRATNFPYKVSVDDPEVLNIDAATDGKDVSWYLELRWSSGDQQGTTRIDDRGKPFRTAGMRGDKAYWYNAVGVGQWEPYQETTG
ncbi:helix-turn-helix domain-containing protein [Streptomyces sp. NPDC058755]|uniref:transcriptional regulator n=1 Tax=Streptomyces sp. NPDC058755 TaxID=3346624 RepID=UPI00367775BA